jgi:protein-tyrosine-phosphatase
VPATVKKVLFVCSRNQWRSPTAERVFATRPGLEVRSAGVDKSALPSGGNRARTRLNVVDSDEIRILNVAGPRLSGWRDGYEFAIAVVRGVIKKSVDG